MHFTKQGLMTNRNMKSQWDDLWAVRNMMSTQQGSMIAANKAVMTPEMLQANAAAGYTREFWQEVDSMVVTSRAGTIGMEILDDLMAIQTTLPVGKTVKSYNIGTGIADDVSVSIDGQSPHSFDHTDYDSDGDPVPVFLAGFGVNWRHAAGLTSVGMDLVLDSQAAKMKVYNESLVSYSLDGKSTLTVDQKQGQGVRTHRNTKKINLGAGGVNIDLATAGAEDAINFFTKGAFATTAIDNFVTAYDVVWVSPQIMANLTSSYVSGGVVVGTIADQIVKRGRVKEFKESFALFGNEFMGYERQQSTLTPLVGMNTGITPLSRPMPNSNYNFQILGAMGMQVKRDEKNRSGVIYAADMG